MCVQVFVTSYQVSEESADINNAVLQAQTIASVYQSNNGEMTSLEKELNLVKEGSNEYKGYVDDNGEFSKATDSKYITQIKDVTADGSGISKIDISIYINETKKQEPILNITATSYEQITKGEVLE